MGAIGCELDGAYLVGTEHFDTCGVETVERVLRREVVHVVCANGDERHLRAHEVKQRFARGGLGAVVTNLQDVAR